MRKSFFTLVLLALAGFVSAQSLQFEWDGHAYGVGEVIECTNDEYGYGEFIQHMQLRNLTGEDIPVVVEKEILEDLEGTMNFFCWGLCFGPDIFVSPDPVVVPANSVTNEEALGFHVIFDEGVFGKVKMRFFAYAEGQSSDGIYIDVVFTKSGEGVVDHARTMTMGKAYPNPASSVVRFDYSFDGSLTAVVYNLLGQEVLRQDLNANDGQMTLSVAGLQEGIYFCTMMVNGRAKATEKFVVKK
jgi:hypothetical protein